MDKDRRRGRGDLTDGARLTRRALLRVAAFSAGAAATQATRPPRAAATSPAMHPVPTVLEAAGLRLDAIQGNSLCGFNKDHQRLLFFELTDARRARAWLGAAVASLASASEVLAFNDLYRRAATNQRSAFPSSVWVNVALTFTGLRALGVSTGDLASFPDAFAQGMRARAAVIGDIGASAPGAWVRPLGSPLLHGVLIVAADQHDQLEAEVGAQLTAMSAAGVRLLLDQAGDVRADQPGHEHFGFKDGISQPGIRGLTPPADPHRPDQGAPGQELLWPGEFVLGYPTQISSPGSGTVGENHEPGPISTSGPAWTADGSYLVFRRLRQDVLAFGTFLAQASAETGLHPDLLGAKLVGRYRSGAPLERTEDQLPAVDPQAADPSLADPTLLGAVRVNNFEFGGDPEGLLVPRAAHIRKVYPRDEDTPTGGEAGTQTHRMIRRGIPYGVSYDAAAALGSLAAATADRGLLFLCYQASVERQFEFVQRRWVNDVNFPQGGDGQDPIISQSSPHKTFAIADVQTSHRLMMANFVTTTGGEYFFQPSLDALRLLSRLQSSAGPVTP